MLRSLLISLVLIIPAPAQIAIHVLFGPTLPAVCSPLTGDVFFLTVGGTGVQGLYSCDATNTWIFHGSGGSTGVLSFNTRIGAVSPANGDYSVGQVTGAAPLNSPALTGTPTSTTPSTPDNSTNIATTAFVKNQNYITTNAVTSVFTRTGAITAQSGDYSISQITNGLSNVLASANIFVGNGSNVATAVAPSGDWTINNTGVNTLATVNSGSGSCGDATHSCAITTNAKGLTTAQTSTAIGFPSQLHSISFTIDGGGSVIATGAVNEFPTVKYACTINQIDITADQSGSVTIDVWKTNAAIPTSSNKISASAPLTLSSAQISQNGSLTGWTTSVSSGDVFGFNVATATTVTKIFGTIWCQ